MTVTPQQTPDRPGFRLLAPYRSLFAATPGASAFAVAGLIGRFPLSMLGLGAVLLVSAVSGSYTLAGAVSATLALSTALANPWIGLLGDRRGQRPILLGCVALHTSGAAALVTAALTDAPRWTLFPAAVVTGASMPPVGSFVRARWTALYGGTRQLQTAFSLESVFDEVVFVIGPILATVLATALWPAFGVVAAASLAALGAMALMLQRRTQPALVPRSPGHASSAIGVAGMRVVALVCVAVGSTFGAVDVSMVAFAEDRGSKGFAGVLLAALAGGSLIAGLLYGVVHWRRPLTQRYLLAVTALAVGTVPLAVVSNFPLMAVACLLAGLAIAPTLVASIGLVEVLVPPSSRTEGFTWVSASLGLGVAIGSSVSGRVVDAFSGQRGFLVTVTSAAVAAVVAYAGARVIARGAVPKVSTVDIQ